MFEARPENSGASYLLVERYKNAAPDELIPYLSIKEIIRKDPQKEGKHILRKAREILEKMGIIFEAVTGIGIKRLTAEALAEDVSVDTLKKTRRSVRRGIRKLEAVTQKDFIGLTSEQKIKYQTSMTLQGLIASQLSAKNIHRVERVVATSMKRLPLDETLKLFMTDRNGEEKK